MDTPPSASPKPSSKRDLLLTGLKEIGSLLSRGLWVFLSILLLFITVGFFLAFICASLIPESIWWRLLTALFVFAIFAVEGWFLALKHALASIIVNAVRRFQLASRILTLLFDTMERLLSEQSLNKIQRLPFRQAETLLRQALSPISSEDPSAGFFRRHIIGLVYRRLVKWVVLLTLAEFRRADAEHGGIELDLARQRLSTKIDFLVEKRVLGSARKLLYLLLILTTLLTLATSLTLRFYPLHSPPTPATLPAFTTS